MCAEEILMALGYRPLLTTEEKTSLENFKQFHHYDNFVWRKKSNLKRKYRHVISQRKTTTIACCSAGASDQISSF